MIDIKNSQLTDIMPENFKYEPENIAISYAIKQTVDTIMDKVKGVYLYSQVDILPEYVLDVMASEFRAQYYNITLDIETKRELVKNALKWHSKAGTPQAVVELAQKVFGQASVIEWFNFAEGEQTPGLFDIKTNAGISSDNRELFATMLADVKNVRSHLRYVLYEATLNGIVNVGGIITSKQHYTLE